MYIIYIIPNNNITNYIEKKKKVFIKITKNTDLLVIFVLMLNDKFYNLTRLNV